VSFRWNPWLGERLALAWKAALAVLGDGGWHSSLSLIYAMTQASGVAEKTAENLLRQCVREAALQDRRGGGARRFARRMFRIHPRAPRELVEAP
jgi:hypothetical protein